MSDGTVYRGVTGMCYIDDCRAPATYFVHSYPDDVRLCDSHSSLHPVEPGERLCTADCEVCDTAAPSPAVSAAVPSTPEETPK